MIEITFQRVRLKYMRQLMVGISWFDTNRRVNPKEIIEGTWVYLLGPGTFNQQCN